MSGHDYERDEWASALAGMSSREREDACGHPYRNEDGVCGVCGHQAYA